VLQLVGWLIERIVVLVESGDWTWRSWLSSSKPLVGRSVTHHTQRPARSRLKTDTRSMKRYWVGFSEHVITTTVRWILSHRLIGIHCVLTSVIVSETKLTVSPRLKTRSSATAEITRDAAIQGHSRSSVVVLIDAVYMTSYTQQ